MSEEQENGEEPKGFAVKDRRRFSTDGEVREDVPDSAAEAAENAASAAPNPKASDALPEIDFSTFVLSLFSSAMVHMGDAPRPDDSTHQDLQLAKQTIDILGLLKAKTAGNLTTEEDKLLADLLCDLQLRYVNSAGQ
jgi:Domain of unknown function (DUF1844)